MTPGERRRECCGERRTSSRLHALLVLGVGVVLVTGVVGLVGRTANFSHLLDALHTADWGWLALCAPGVIAA